MLALGRVDGGRDGEDAGKDAIDIAVDGGMGQPESHRGDGGSGVVAHSLEAAYLLVGIGKGSALHYLPCCGVEIACPRVVTQSLPQLEHLVFAGGCQVCHGRIGVHEPQPVLRALADACLLEDNLGKPDGIGVTASAPREFAPVAMSPLEESGRKCFIVHNRHKITHFFHLTGGFLAFSAYLRSK